MDVLDAQTEMEGTKTNTQLAEEFIHVRSHMPSATLACRIFTTEDVEGDLLGPSEPIAILGLVSVP